MRGPPVRGAGQERSARRGQYTRNDRGRSGALGQSPRQRPYHATSFASSPFLASSRSATFCRAWPSSLLNPKLSSTTRTACRPASSRGRPRDDAVGQAVRVVDDNFGFNKLLGQARQKVALRLLARNGELAKLVAWYGR